MAAKSGHPTRFDVARGSPGARAAFFRLLDRLFPTLRAPHGKSLLLLGEAGSGKRT